MIDIQLRDTVEKSKIVGVANNKPFDVVEAPQTMHDEWADRRAWSALQNNYPHASELIWCVPRLRWSCGWENRSGFDTHCFGPSHMSCWSIDVVGIVGGSNHYHYYWPKSQGHSQSTFYLHGSLWGDPHNSAKSTVSNLTRRGFKEVM